MAALGGDSPGQVGVGEEICGGKGWRDQPGATAVSAHLTVGVAVHVTVLAVPGHHSHRARAGQTAVLLYGEGDVEHGVLLLLTPLPGTLQPQGWSGLTVGGFP